MISTEEQDHMALVELLELKKILYCHVPNEGQHKVQYRVKQKKMGVKPGVPDILIFDSPPRFPDKKGLAIELKRAKRGRVSKEQQKWIEALEQRGWVATVCYGIDGAIEALKYHGY